MPQSFGPGGGDMGTGASRRDSWDGRKRGHVERGDVQRMHRRAFFPKPILLSCQAPWLVDCGKHRNLRVVSNDGSRTAAMVAEKKKRTAEDAASSSDFINAWRRCLLRG